MAQLKNVVDTIDLSKEITTEVKEALTLLYELSEAKANAFEEEIHASLRTAGTVENKSIPISSTLSTQKEIRVVTSTSALDGVVSTIADSLKTIISGSANNIIDGIATLIDKSLSVIFGKGQGSETYVKQYFVTTEGMSIIRLDMICWARAITAESIVTHAERSVVCTVVKSSVNVGDIDFNTFIAAYNGQLSRCNFSQEEIIQELENAKRIFDLLSGGMKNLEFNGMHTKGTEDLLELENFAQAVITTQDAQGYWPIISGAAISKKSGFLQMTNEMCKKTAIDIHMAYDPKTTSYLCNQFVHEIFKKNNIEGVSQLEYTNKFLPFDKINLTDAVEIVIDPNTHLLKFDEQDNLNFGDVIVFYSIYSKNDISHTMVYMDTGVCLGCNHGSTFQKFEGDSSLKYVDLLTCKVSDHVTKAYAISPKSLQEYHNNQTSN